MNLSDERVGKVLQSLTVGVLKAALAAIWTYTVWKLATKFLETEHGVFWAVVIAGVTFLSLAGLLLVLVGSAVFRGLMVFDALTKAVAVPFWCLLGWEVDRDGMAWLAVCGILTFLLVIADQKPIADSEVDRDRDERER